ncbi:hypothetical protein TNIN_291551 [Trichonephila inaurata madagascariensis]|uniref:Uncharacterized protein n=1 Tax=Trichonephila inaurata madagascariensis TaxID=2747483 RepID=A0A8X6YF76_9ARAC|nr:hypothetical protein TNIN_291551 [Trichonephila inaurata madagascariensis]
MWTTTPLLQTMLICRFVYMHCISGVNKTASKEDEEDVEEQWDGDRIIRGRDESYQCDVVHQEADDPCLLFSFIREDPTNFPSPSPNEGGVDRCGLSLSIRQALPTDKINLTPSCRLSLEQTMRFSAWLFK